ncbi:hypothetical protein GQ600_12283 [Phytophthora cactorum]|nr:hypothetical protein GQ600_12283 [Phytophthora cactorum]
MCGNTTDPGDASVCPGKSSLFFLTSISYLGTDYPAIRRMPWQSTLFLKCPARPRQPLKSWLEIYSHPRSYS